jgi:hypothetical protein
MTETTIRDRTLTRGFLMLLVLLMIPAAALTFGVPSELHPGPSAATAAAAPAAPWSRSTFVKIQADGAVPSTQPKVKATQASPPLQVPATVENLRRTD